MLASMRCQHILQGGVSYRQKLIYSRPRSIRASVAQIEQPECHKVADESVGRESAPSCSSTSPSGAQATTFTRLSPTERAVALLTTSGLLGFVVLEDEWPAVRLAILTYMVWAMGEWLVHRYFMHARSGSLADRLTHINKLHVEHHADTLKDMTMKEGYSVDALYFHFPNTCIQVLAGTAVLASLDAALALDIPLWWTSVSSLLFAVTHNLLWNTMHMDMHDSHQELKDGIPCVDYQRAGWYVQWVFDNHTTHHDVGGSQNYNVVCPGPDFVLNTYLHRNKSVQL